MELAEILKRRRMVRHYAPEPVDPEALERILATVRRAPSGGYSQGQRLVVVTAEATRRRIAALAGEEGDVAAGREPWIASAPVHVVVCAREQDYHDRYRKPDKLQGGAEIEWPVPYWYVDAGAALMLLLLGAIDEGLAAGVFGLSAGDLQPLKDLLAIPDDVLFVAVVTIGKAAPDLGWSAMTSRRTQPRRPLEQLVHRERWTGT